MVLTQSDGLTGVGETALGAAMMRAEESGRPDRLFDDPLATAFVAAAPDPFVDGPDPGDPEIAALTAAFQTQIAVRTRFYDDYLRAACAGGARQVVLLAAGLDARAYRLDWPDGVQLFELDLPEVLAFKEKVLAGQRAIPRCTRIAVTVDLRDKWPGALTAAGFDRDARSAWTLEGLLAYLSDDAAVRLLTYVSDLSCSGSTLALEAASVADDATLSRARDLPALDQIAALWEGGLQRDAAEWLRHQGWRVDQHDRGVLAVGYGRPILDASTGGFLSATRQPPT